jgi:trehalose synthase
MRIWQRHVDLSSPNPAVWSYLRSFLEQYDSAVFSMPDYAQQLGVEQRIIAPAINPFSPKNREMSEDEINDWLERYRVPSGRPLVVQVSRFDR